MPLHVDTSRVTAAAGGETEIFNGLDVSFVSTPTAAPAWDQPTVRHVSPAHPVRRTRTFCAPRASALLHPACDATPGPQQFEPVRRPVFSGIPAARRDRRPARRHHFANDAPVSIVLPGAHRDRTSAGTRRQRCFGRLDTERLRFSCASTPERRTLLRFFLDVLEVIVSPFSTEKHGRSRLRRGSR